MENYSCLKPLWRIQMYGTAQSEDRFTKLLKSHLKFLAHTSTDGIAGTAARVHTMNNIK